MSIYFLTEEESENLFPDLRDGVIEIPKDGHNNSNSGVENSFYGKTHTEESKQKISETQRKRGYKHKEASKQKMSEANRRRRHSQETKRKIGDARKGKKHTEESKQKMSDACKSAWIRRKENNQ